MFTAGIMAATGSDEHFQKKFDDLSGNDSFSSFSEDEGEAPRYTTPFHQIYGDCSLPCDEQLGWQIGDYTDTADLVMPDQVMLSLPFTGRYYRALHG